MQEGGNRHLSPTLMLERSASFTSASSHAQQNISSGGSPCCTKEGEVLETSIVRESLLAGRLHHAVTFGLDIPSLLLADPLAKDCPPRLSYAENSDCDWLNGHPDKDGDGLPRQQRLQRS